MIPFLCIFQMNLFQYWVLSFKSMNSTNKMLNNENVSSLLCWVGEKYSLDGIESKCEYVRYFNDFNSLIELLVAMYCHNCNFPIFIVIYILHTIYIHTTYVYGKLKSTHCVNWEWFRIFGFQRNKIKTTNNVKVKWKIFC